MKWRWAAWADGPHGPEMRGGGSNFARYPRRHGRPCAGRGMMRDGLVDRAGDNRQGGRYGDDRYGQMGGDRYGRM